MDIANSTATWKSDVWVLEDMPDNWLLSFKAVVQSWDSICPKERFEHDLPILCSFNFQDFLKNEKAVFNIYWSQLFTIAHLASVSLL